MAGLLGYALAGGLTGYGNSLVEDAKAKREAAMEELRNSRLMEREDRDRSFRTSEREASQGFTSRENETNRAQQREMGGTLLDGPDGQTFREQGGTARPVVGEDGQPVTGLRRARTDGGSTLSAAQRRVAISEVDKVYNSNFDIEAAVGDLMLRGLEDEQVTEWARNKLRAEGRQQKEPDPNRYAESRLRELGLIEGGPDAPPAGQGAQPVAQPRGTPNAEGARVGANIGAMVNEGTAPVPRAPRDPSVRVVGQIYAAPDGRKVRWTGEGWEIVE